MLIYQALGHLIKLGSKAAPARQHQQGSTSKAAPARQQE
jgi:hypothetical protein